MLPKISVIVTAYNHEKYIAECIESILTQSFSDFELIIIDDGSRDRTSEIIHSFNDSRIIYIYQDNNGPSSALNTAISHAQAEYLTVISGDDKAYKNRLEIQYNYFLENPHTTLLFGRCELIDEKSNLLKNHLLNRIFNYNIVNMDRYELFHRLFFHGNFLCAPAHMMRRSFFINKTNGYHIASLQLQDYFMWMQWLKFSEISFIDEKLAYYRIRDRQKNLSNPNNEIRVKFERETILEKIIDDVDISFFKKAFFHELIDPHFKSMEAFELEKSYIYLKFKEPQLRMIGLKKLFNLLQDPLFQKVYLEKYHLTYIQFYSHLKTQKNNFLKRVGKKLLNCYC